MPGVQFSYFKKSLCGIIHKIMATATMHMDIYKTGRHIFTPCINFCSDMCMNSRITNFYDLTLIDQYTSTF